MRRYITTAKDLKDLICDLRPDLGRLEASVVRDAMHARGWSRYESLGDAEIATLCDDMEKHVTAQDAP